MPQAGQHTKHCELKYINRDPGNRPDPAPKPLGIRAKALSPPQSYWEVGGRGNHLWSILVFLVYVPKNLQPKIEFFVHMSACLSFSTCLFGQRERNGHEETMDVGKGENHRFGEDRAWHLGDKRKALSP